MFSNLFDVVNESPVQSTDHGEEFTDDEIDKLEQLEEAVENDAT